jgi:hypothetical protein
MVQSSTMISGSPRGRFRVLVSMNSTSSSSPPSPAIARSRLMLDLASLACFTPRLTASTYPMSARSLPKDGSNYLSGTMQSVSLLFRSQGIGCCVLMVRIFCIHILIDDTQRPQCSQGTILKAKRRKWCFPHIGVVQATLRRSSSPWFA